MIVLDDTIAAVSTPPGESGIGIVRLSGKGAVEIAGRLFRSPKGKDLVEVPSHTIHYGYIVSPDGSDIMDEVLLSVMKAPHTFTREDVVEINCHGGILPIRRVLEAVIGEGARLAGPGEFTLRAFMNGRIDLSQAEATIDLIRAKTEQSGRIALEQLSGGLSKRITGFREILADTSARIEAYIDFPEEDLELSGEAGILESVDYLIRELERLSKSYEGGRFFREGVSVAIVGRPNVGKSSLLNAMMGSDRAIVTDVPGTTRDIIEEYINLNGIPLRIMDTAGIREARNLAESEGVRRSLRAIEGADIVLTLFDSSRPLSEEDRHVMERVRGKKCILVLNKSDLVAELNEAELPDEVPRVGMSAKTLDGLESLKAEIERTLLREVCLSEGVVITNLRHRIAIDRACDALRRGMDAITSRKPYEIIALELRDALDGLGEIVGSVTTEDILNRIFAEFCIGK